MTYMPGGVAEWAAQGYTFETGQDPGGVISPTPVSPTVMSSDASVTSSSVQLNGNLTALGKASSVMVSFEWGPTTSYGNMTTPESKSAIGTFTASVTGLTPATTYHFRVKAVGNWYNLRQRYYLYYSTIAGKLHTYKFQYRSVNV